MSEEPFERGIIDVLRMHLERAQVMLAKPIVHLGMLPLFSAPVRFQLAKLYGERSPALASFPGRAIDRNFPDPRAELTKRMEQVRRLVQLLEAAPNVCTSPLISQKIFIGHGHSYVWLQLKQFIQTRTGLECDEYNVEAAAGISTTERIDVMLSQAAFAFAVMTAEEVHVDGRAYARPNVIYEYGLFQGKLGARRAIILLEDGCSEFSHIMGLSYIPFPRNNLKPAFEDVRRVLERENLIRSL